MLFAISEMPSVHQHFVEAGHLGKVLALGLLFILIGGLAVWWSARRMHVNHVHWSWSAIFSGVFLLLGLVTAGHTISLLFFGLAAVSLCTTRRSRRWRERLKMRGGEQAQIAREQWTLLYLLRGWVIRYALRAENDTARSNSSRSKSGGGEPSLNALREWAASATKTSMSILYSLLVGGGNSHGKQIFLGCDSLNHNVSIAPKHMFVAGGTGSGKTTAILRILKEVVRVFKAQGEGIGCVTVDGKGDPALKLALKLLAKVMGVPFRAWSPKGTLKYDFLAHGGNTERVDRALASDTYSDPYFLRLAQRFLGFAVRALVAAGEPVTLKNLAYYVIPSNLKELGERMEKRKWGSWEEFEKVPELKGRELEAVQGTQHRLSVLAESDMGPLLEPGESAEDTLNLLEAVRNREIVYFDLHASANPEAAKMLGAVIIIDLMTVFATLQYSTTEDPETGEEHPEYHPTLVILDDITSYASPDGIAGVASLYARSRSVGAVMIVGTQSFADMKFRDGGSLMEAILDSRWTLIVLRVPGAASAKRASEEFGEFEERCLAEHVGRDGREDGSGTVQTRRTPFVQPSDLQRLPTGVAYVDSVESDGPRKTWIAMAA